MTSYPQCKGTQRSPSASFFLAVATGTVRVWAVNPDLGMAVTVVGSYCTLSLYCTGKGPLRLYILLSVLVFIAPPWRTRSSTYRLSFFSPTLCPLQFMFTMALLKSARDDEDEEAAAQSKQSSASGPPCKADASSSPYPSSNIPKQRVWPASQRRRVVFPLPIVEHT